MDQITPDTLLPIFLPLHEVLDDNSEGESEAVICNSPLLSLPSELLSRICSYLSLGSIFKLSTTTRRLSHLSLLAYESHNSPQHVLAVSKSMLALSGGVPGVPAQHFEVNFEVRFNPVRAYRALRGLATTCTDTTIRIDAMITLAKSHLDSVSVSLEATREARMVGVKLLEDAFEVCASDPLPPSYGSLVETGRYLSGLFERGGKSMPISMVDSTSWLRRCAEVGDLESIVDYALCLELGHGVEGDEKEAFKWWRRAGVMEVNEDDEDEVELRGEARYNMGKYYEEGRGGARMDLTRAVMWYKMAVDDGDEDADRGLERLKDIRRIIKGVELGDV